MIRILYLLIVFFSFSFSLELHEPMFPKGEELRKFIVNDGLKGKALFLNNKNTFVTLEGTYDIKINFFNLKNGKKFFQIKAKESRISDVSIAKEKPYLIYVEQADEKPIVINIFDIKNKRIIHTLELKERIKSICISNNAKYIVYTTHNNKIYIYDREEHKQLSMFRTQKPIKNIKIDTFNKYIFTLEEDSIVMYDFETFQKLQEFHLGEKIYLNKFDISRDGKYFLSVSNRKNLKVWDIKNRELKIERKIPYIVDAKFTDDSKKIIYGEKENLKILDIATNKSIFVARDKHLKQIYSISVGDNSEVLVNDRFLINIETFNLINLSKRLGSGIEHYIEESFYVKKLNIIFSRDKENGIKVWNLYSNSLEYIIDKENKINDMALSQNEKYLIFSTDRTLKVWDVEEKELIKEFIEENSTIQNIAISSSGKKIVFKVDKKLKILDFELWEIITEIEDESLLYQLNFLKEEYLIVHAFQEIKVFDIKTKKLVNHIKDKNNQLIEVYKDSPYYRVYYYMKLKSEIKNILTNEIVATFSKDNYVYEVFNEKAYVGDLENEKLDVWDLKQKKVVKEEKRQYFESVAFGNSITLLDTNWNIFDGEHILKEVFYNDNSWAIIDYQTKKFYRYGNKDFLLDTKTFEPIIDNDTNISKGDVKVFFEKEDITLSNNTPSIFTIQVKNISKHKLYWIKPNIDDENFMIEANSIVDLEPNEIKSIQVSLQYNELVKESFLKDLIFKITVGGKKVKEKELKVNIEKRKDIDIESIELTDMGRFIKVKIHKYINSNLTNIKVILSEGNKSIEYNPFYNIIETKELIIVTLNNDKTFFYTWLGKGHDFTAVVDADEIRPYKFQKHVKFDMPEIFYIFILMLIFLFIAMLYFIYIGKYNLRLNKITKGVDDILNVPLHKLPYYKKFLKRRIDKHEYEQFFNYILENDLERVSQFFRINSQKKAQLFTEKANGKLKKINNNFFEIQLSKNFELSLDTFLLYFPSTTSTNEMYTVLKDKRATAIIVIGQNEEEQRLISESNQLLELPNVIGISSRNLKLFLLQSEHTKSLANIFANKIDRTLISPYQSEGKVENELYFFGREKIIENIYNKELSNYFIVGARQIGKSSLLKALERKFKDREDVVCITIEDTRYLLKEMATSLGLDRKSSLEEIELFISNSLKKYLFLIDEVDAFVQEEKENNYEMLHAFRALSQKKKAYFIMAGYWELFFQISFDYYSPIKNFGETIKLDKLEWNACTELVLIPMDNLNLNYKSTDDAAEILMQTGQRANLIAMVCDKIVKDLKPLSFVITKEDVENALYYNDELQKTYYSWREIPNNKRQSYITQIIVYNSVEVDYFSLESVIELFERLGLLEKVTLEEIEESLQRLDLMYIIEKNKHNVYWYTIPLMKEELMKDSNVRLKKVIDEFRKEYC